MKAQVVSRQTIVPSPAPGVGVYEGSFYARHEGLDLISVAQYTTRSDTVDGGIRRYSSDIGRSWSEPEKVVTGAIQYGGTMRRWYYPSGYVDPPTGRLLEFRNEGVLPRDNPMQGVRYWRCFYTVSEDGGKSFTVNEPIIQDGAEFSAEHPWPGLWIGRNGACIGAPTVLPLKDGTILVPCYQHPLGPDGQYYNPGGGVRYHEAVMLRGRWRPDGGLTWQASKPIQASLIAA